MRSLSFFSLSAQRKETKEMPPKTPNPSLVFAAHGQRVPNPTCLVFRAVFGLSSLLYDQREEVPYQIWLLGNSAFDIARD